MKKLGLMSALLGATVGVCVAMAPPATACSMCRCGDPTYSMIGSQIFMPKRLRLGFDVERFSKDQAAEHEHGALEHEHAAPEHDADAHAEREEQIEERYTFSLGYTAGKRLTLVARVPISHRAITTADVTERMSGLADPELLAHVRLTGAGRPGSWLALSGALQTGWGQNDKRLDGERAEEHLQPGSGAATLSGQLAFARLLDNGVELFGSTGGRFSGRNEHGYRYGSVWLANLAAERRLWSRLNGVVELNFRSAARDEVTRGEHDENTGGAVLYVSPRLLFKLDPAQNVWLRVGLQVPVFEDLHGDQDEKVNLLAGLTLRF